MRVPPLRQVDEKGEGRVVRASVPALSATWFRRRPAGSSLILCEGLDRPLGEAVVAAALATSRPRATGRFCGDGVGRGGDAGAVFGWRIDRHLSSLGTRFEPAMVSAS